MALEFGLLDSLFSTSAAVGEGLGAPIVNQVIWKDVGIGIVPIGSVVAWFKSLTTTPPLLPNYVECNGQVLADGDSPLNGETIPNLNANRFLRGQATSGGTGGSETHRHSLHRDNSASTGTNTFADESATGYFSTLPTYTNVVWIMRIK